MAYFKKRRKVVNRTAFVNMNAKMYENWVKDNNVQSFEESISKNLLKTEDSGKIIISTIQN